jgi:hypothetical protein
MRLIVSVSVTILLAMSFQEDARAQSQCEDGYALCMSGCTNDATAERCMQSCQGARDRCVKFGVFKMPAGFVLNQGVMEYIVGQNAQGRALSEPKEKPRRSGVTRPQKRPQSIF